MNSYNAKDILNISIVGHSGSGKTSLAESMLYVSDSIKKLGNVNAGNTVCDFEPYEISKKSSISTSIAQLKWKNKKINLLDTPGLLDLEGEVREAIRVSESAIITVDGKSGIHAGTEKVVKLANQQGLSKIFFVNGICDASSRFYKVFENLKAKFGPAVCPVVVPFIVDGKAECYINLLEYKAYSYSNGRTLEVPIPDMGNRLNGLRTAIYESVAESSEDMFDKYFSGDSFTPEEVMSGISKGVKEGTIYPVFCGDALSTYAIDQLLNGIAWLLPSADNNSKEIATDINGNYVQLSINKDAPSCAYIFKTVIEPFIGKISYLKVMSGKISKDSTLTNMTNGENEKINKVVNLMGKEQKECDCLSAGDIGAILKLQHSNTGDTICSPIRKLILEKAEYPDPCFSMAIHLNNHSDEDKLTQNLVKLTEEDPSLKIGNNDETHELIISGLGEQHLDLALNKIKSKLGFEIEFKNPKIPYRETIRKSVKVQGRYKKQTGGHGQYGDVWIEFSPCEENYFTFEEKIVGGSIPKGFFPAIEKGLLESIKKGPLAGYPLVNVKATLYDGSYHPVDSSEMSFKMAASLAYKNGISKADPILLEPIGKFTINVNNNYTGDIIGEIAKRRGKVLGMDSANDNTQIIDAEIPLAEAMDFSTFIQQITQGYGNFKYIFSHYQDIPENISNKILNLEYQNA